MMSYGRWSRARAREALRAAALLFSLALPVASQTPVHVGSEHLRNLHVWAGTDTMISRAKLNGTWREPNGTGYVHRVVADEAGYRLVNTWFDATGDTTAIQESSIGPFGSWPVTVRVRAATDSASLRIMDASVIGWEFPPGEEGAPRLYDFPLEHASLPGDLGQVLVAGLPLERGQELSLAYFTLLVPAAPMEEKKRIFRVAGHDVLNLNGAPVESWVLEETRSTGTNITLWTAVDEGRILAIRGQPPGGRFEWWHVLKGLTLPEGN